MDLLHRARERGHHRAHVGDGADHRHARREPRALEMAGDLVAHDLGLLAHLQRERIAAVGGRLVHHHRDRRLERMREIADMGARARDDLAIGVDQRIGLARERRDLDREGAFQPLGAARADRGKPLGDALERRQAEADLEGRGQQQHDRQHREGDDQRAVEAVRLLVDLGGIAGDRDQEAPLLAEIDGALDHAQSLVLRTLDIALPGAARAPSEAARSSRCGRVQSHSEREERTSGVRCIEPRHLPVPARQRQIEQRLAERLRELAAFSSGVATSATSVRR